MGGNRRDESKEKKYGYMPDYINSALGCLFVPILLDGSQLFYDQSGNHEPSDPVAALSFQF